MFFADKDRLNEVVQMATTTTTSTPTPTTTPTTTPTPTTTSTITTTPPTTPTPTGTAPSESTSKEPLSFEVKLGPIGFWATKKPTTTNKTTTK